MPPQLDIEMLLATATILMFAYWARPPTDRSVHGALAFWLRSQERAPKYLFTIAACLAAEHLVPHTYTVWAAMALGATCTALFFNGYRTSPDSFWSRRRNRFLGLTALLTIWAFFFVSTIRPEAYYLALAAPIFHRSIRDKRDFIRSNLQDIEALRHKVAPQSFAQAQSSPASAHGENSGNAFEKIDQAG